MMFSIFISMFLALNAYSLLRIASIYSYNPTLGYYALILVASLSFIIVTILANTFHNTFTNLLYRVASVWLGALAILTPILLLEHLLSLIFTYNQEVMGSIAIWVAAVLSVYALYNAHTFKHKDIIIQTDKVSKPYDLVHISDLHLGPIHKGRYLNTLIAEVQSLDADVVVITGDLIDIPAILPNDLLTPFNKLDIPIYATSGNHDRYAGIPVLKGLIEKTKIEFIDDVHARFEEISFVGISDTDNKQMVSENLPLIDARNFTVLSYHRPIEFEHAAEAGVDLMLAGHTHAGQLFSFRPLVQLEFNYIWGVYKHLNSTLHVTSGTGTWGPPMRLGSSNEITRIRIIPE